MAQQRSAAAKRILDAAIRLFAEQGYDRTSIADIQAAVGLRPGSGALYKHFASKEAVLREGIEEFIAEGARGQDVIALLPAEPEAALEVLANGVLDSLSAQQDLIRIIWRDLDPFPDLRERVVQQRMQRTFDALSAWIEQASESGRIRSADSRAHAVVALSALVHYQVFQTLLRATPGEVDRDRFVRAWAELVLHGLETQAAG